MRSRVLPALCVIVAVVFSVNAAAKTKPPQLPVRSLNLGDTNADLVYTPMNPCRVADTRVAGGFMAGGTTRSFQVAGSSSFAAQGGSASGCGVPSGATAAQLNVTAVDPDALGNLKGSAYPNPIPVNGAVVNYQALNPNLNVANAIILPLCDPSVSTCDFDITLFTNGGGTQVVIDVLGYFKRFPAEQMISALTPGTGMTGGGTTGAVTLGVADSGVGTQQLATGAVTLDNIVNGTTAGQMLTFNGAALGWQSQPQGTITGVTVGPGLTGGGTSGAISVGAAFPPSTSISGASTAIARSDHKHYWRTIIVGPVGTDAQNGSSLSTAVQNITDASATNPYLIKIEPGVYQIDPALSLQTKPYIDLEGSGEQSTRITHVGSGTFTVVAGSNAELRFLSIESTGTSNAFGVQALDGTRLQRVKVVATGTGLATGIAAGSFANVSMTDVSITATGDSSGAVGITGTNGSTLRLRRVAIVANGTNSGADGITATGGTLTADDCDIRATASSAFQGRGVTASSGQSVTIANSSITASGSPAFGVSALSSNVTLTNANVSAASATSPATGLFLGPTVATTRAVNVFSSAITATSTGSSSYGIEGNGSGGSITALVDASQISGNSNAVLNLTSTTVTIKIGGSRLLGGSNVSATCAFVSNQANVALSTTCN